MAKRFKFRLQRVLDYREAIKSERKRELLVKNQELSEGQQRLSELAYAIANNHLRQDSMLTIEELQLVGNYTVRLKQMIDWQRAKIISLEKEAAEALERYIEASKDVEALQVLKRKREEDHRRYVEQEESKFLDELTTQRYLMDLPGD